MKSFSLFLGTLALSLNLFAQLPDGSIAPDFTLTDINGQSHSLYADYLEQGKTVILDFSATWCGPCWDLFQQGTMKDLYNAFGPEGTDNLMVFKLECDPTTGLDELNGIGSSTLGDWVTGTPFPILDGEDVYNLSNTYQVPGYPTWYTICPSGILKASDWNGQGYNTVSQHVQIAFADCGYAVTDPAAIMSYSGDEFYCGNDNWQAEGELTNLGPIDINSATFEVSFNGNTETVTYNGSVTTNQTVSVDFGTFNNNSGEFEATLTSLNGQPRNVADSQDIIGSTLSSGQIVVEIMPDPYGTEVSWEILDDNDNIVATATCDNPADFTWEALSVVQDWVVQVPSLGCYTFKLKDSYGDGLTPGVPSNPGPSGDPNEVFYPFVNVYSFDGTSNGATILSVDTEAGDSYAYEVVRGFEVTEPASGCVDEEACNYDSEATIDDGSCEYPALYVDCNGICLNDADGDGVCNELEILGCGIPAACNFDPSATDQDITLCVYPGDACDDQDDGTTGDTFDSNCTCIGQGPQPGCLNPVACNFDMNADYSDGSCLFPGDPCDDGNASTSNDMFSDSCGCEGESNVVGCINPNACNYNPDATESNGSCLFPGDPCDDGDASTFNDMFSESCGCVGESNVVGCINPNACNYNPEATESDGSCLFPGDPCDDGDAATLNEMYDDSCVCHEDEVSKLTENILDVALYPNPVRDWLNVRLEDGVAASLVLFDPTGRTVHTWSTVGPTRLDLRHLPQGQYVMSIRPAFGPIRSERIALLAWD